MMAASFSIIGRPVTSRSSSGTDPTSRLPKDLLERVMSVFMGPEGHVVCYYLREGTLLNLVGCVETEETSEESWTTKRPWATTHGASIAWDGTRRAVTRWSFCALPRSPQAVT